MSTLCGWASISENNTVNGKVGDQTKREVKTGKYYNFGQTDIIRFKDETKRPAASLIMAALCNNENIGYGQKDRTTLYKLANNLNWDPEKINEIGKCNCDCSELIAVVINFVFNQPIIPSTVYTGNLIQVCYNTGHFDIISSFTEKDLILGDIIIKPKHHVIMVIRTSETKPLAKSETKNEVTDYVVGNTYTIVATDLQVREGAGINFKKIEHNKLSENAQKNDKDLDGSLDYGTKVTCLDVKIVGTDIWVKIPSGWIAAKYKGKQYLI